MLLDMARLIKANRTLLNSNIFPHEEMSIRVLLAKERILKLIQVWDEKQIKPWSLPELLLQLSNDSQTIAKILKQREEKHVEHEQAANLAVQKEQEEQAVQSFTPYWNFPMIDDDDEYAIQYREYLENSSNAITPELSTEEPDYSLSMGTSILTLFRKRNRTNDDDSFEDIDYVEASPPDFELVSIEEVEDDILRAKSSNIYLLIAKIESLNDNPTPSSLSLSHNSLLEFETFSNHTEETRSGSTTTHAENSLPGYDSFHFEIESDQGELSRVVMKTIVEIDAFLDIDVSTDLEDGYHDSKGDIIYLESLLINNTIPNLFPDVFFDHEQ
ncbi:hypothetical protein Tco_1119067 [Tanacetum coccineum]